MAVFETTHPAAILRGDTFTVLRNALGAISTYLGHVAAAMVSHSRVNRRFEQVRALQALSDEELAAKGMRRDDIVHHVFSDMYFL